MWTQSRKRSPRGHQEGLREEVVPPQWALGLGGSLQS